MIHLKDHFMYSPGGENENSYVATLEKKVEQKDQAAETPKGKEEKDKPILTKIKEALQEWSNKDQEDLEFDDTRV